MSNPDNVSTGELLGLVNVSATALAPSISTLVLPRALPPSHVTPPTSAMSATTASTSGSSSSASKAPDYQAFRSAIAADPLLKSLIAAIPKLTGAETYANWWDKLTAVLNHFGITKILTGEWTQPPVTSSDPDSEKNAAAWKALDTWIILHLNLSDSVNSQVRHLTSAHDKWTVLVGRYRPTSSTSITLHLTSIVNIRFDESTTTFEDFVASKCEHNRMIGELGGQSMPDSHVAILIRSGLPDHLKQYVAHLTDDTISTDQLVNIIRSRQQESAILTMQNSTSDTALYGHQNKSKKKRDLQPCKTPGCPRPNTHQTKNCWAPGGPKHDPNRKRKSNRKGKDRAHKVDGDDDDDEDDSGSTTMNIYIDRGFVGWQPDSDLLYFPLAEPSPSSTTSQAHLTKGPTPIIIDSGITSHIHNKRLYFELFLDKDDTNNITGFRDQFPLLVAEQRSSGLNLLDAKTLLTAWAQGN